jgi:hypothetical protein
VGLDKAINNFLEIQRAAIQIFLLIIARATIQAPFIYNVGLREQAKVYDVIKIDQG